MNLTMPRQNMTASLPGSKRRAYGGGGGATSAPDSAFLSETWDSSEVPSYSSSSMRRRLGGASAPQRRPVSSSVSTRSGMFGAEYQSRPNSRAQLNRARKCMVAEGYLEERGGGNGNSEGLGVSRGGGSESMDVAMASLFNSSSGRLNDADLDVLLGSKSKPSTPSTNTFGTLTGSAAYSSSYSNVDSPGSASRRRRRPQTSGDIDGRRSRSQHKENIFARSSSSSFPRGGGGGGGRGLDDDNDDHDDDDDEDDDDLGISARSAIKQRAAAAKLPKGDLPSFYSSSSSALSSSRPSSSSAGPRAHGGARPGPPPKKWSTRVLSCGSNGNFQAGCDSGRVYVTELEPVGRLHQSLDVRDGDYVLQVAAGLTCSLAATSCGDAYAWGSLKYTPQKGSAGTMHKQKNPNFMAQTPVKLVLPKHERLSTSKMLVNTVACGHEHAAIVTRNGVLLTWGNGRAGCLGHGDELNAAAPKVVEALRNQPVTGVCCGAAHTAATVALMDGNNASLLASRARMQALFMWGSNRAGQLGLGEAVGGSRLAVPTHVRSFTQAGLTVARIACGMHHTLAVGEVPGEEDASWLYSWGFGEDGRLGVGDEEAHFEPLQVPLPGGRVISVAAGEQHSLALLDSHELYAWGSNRFGQLGVGKHTDKELIPIEVPSPWRRGEAAASSSSSSSSSSAIQPIVVCGARHSGVVTGSGRLYLWGWGEEGQLGNGSEMSGPRPKEAAVPEVIEAVAARVCSVALGGTHTLVLCHNAAIKREAIADLLEVEIESAEVKDEPEPIVQAQAAPPLSPVNHSRKEAVLVYDDEDEEEEAAVFEEKEDETVVEEPPKRNQRAIEIVMRERERREEERKKQKERQERILLEQQQQQQQRIEEQKKSLVPTRIPSPTPVIVPTPDLPSLHAEKVVQKKSPPRATLPPAAKPKPKPKIGVFYKGSSQQDMMDQLLVANSAQAAMRRKQRREESLSRQRASTAGAAPSHRRSKGGGSRGKSGLGFGSNFEKASQLNLFQPGGGAGGTAGSGSGSSMGNSSSAVNLRRQMIQSSMSAGAVSLSKTGPLKGDGGNDSRGSASVFGGRGDVPPLAGGGAVAAEIMQMKQMMQQQQQQGGNGKASLRRRRL